MHLLGASELNDKTVIPELKKAILDETLAFLAEAPEGEISIQANAMVESCVDVFYEGSESKFKYLIDSLQKGASGETKKL